MMFFIDVVIFFWTFSYVFLENNYFVANFTHTFLTKTEFFNLKL